MMYIKVYSPEKVLLETGIKLEAPVLRLSIFFARSVASTENLFNDIPTTDGLFYLHVQLLGFCCYILPNV